MEQLFEYLIPAFVVLYFVLSTVYAVLKRLSTPDLPWPAEPEEPGEAPWWEPVPVEERPEAAGGPPGRGRPEPVAPVPGPEPLPRRPVSQEPVGQPPVFQRPDPDERGLPARPRPEAGEEGEGAGELAAQLRGLASPVPKPRAAAVAPERRARLRRMLRGAGLRDAVLLAEVIGPPRALRPYAPPPLEKR